MGYSRFISFLALISLANSAKVLVWSPLMGRSHVRFMARMADILVTDGHNVTLFQTIFDPDTVPLYNTLAQDIIVHHPSDWDPNLLYSFDYKTDQMFKRKEMLFRPDNAKNLLQVSLTQCRGLINDHDLILRLRKEKFDLIVFEIIDPCPGLWLQYLNIDKLIVASSYGMAPVMDSMSGLHSSPSFVPYLFRSFGNEMTYFERFENFIYAIFQHTYLQFVSSQLMLLAEKLPKLPNTQKLISPMDFLAQKTSAYFINANEFSEVARPVGKNFVHVGGMMVDEKQEPLSGDYARLYDSCPQGVVVFSFGSMVKMSNFPLASKLEMLASFKRFPELCFVWKTDASALTSDRSAAIFANVTSAMSNLFVRTWIPQQQLLADKRTKAFITHAGAMSTNEAFAFGTPVITIPLYLDNYHNSAAIVRHGLGVAIDKLDITETVMTEAINEIVYGNSSKTTFQQRANLAAAILKPHRHRITSEITYWARQVAEFGPLEHLVLNGTQLSLLQVYLIDILVPLGALLSAIVYGSVRLMQKLFKENTFATKVKLN
uniref:glucuronosyltransferase n=1 Tax=Panagrellus redivivus TaxID=6233 RepID=A0A7E4VZQ6_PANRE